MEKYTALLKSPYLFTTNQVEIPPRVLEKIRQKTAVDFGVEQFVCACWMDSFLARGNFFVIVTNERIIVQDLATWEQNLIRDLTGVEQDIHKNIVLRSAGNTTKLFSISSIPPKALTTRLLQQINSTWIQAKKQNQYAGPGSNSDHLDQLEKIARLKESGALTDDEFYSMKKEILSKREIPTAKGDPDYTGYSYSNPNSASSTLKKDITSKSKSKIPITIAIFALFSLVKGLMLPFIGFLVSALLLFPQTYKIIQTRIPFFSKPAARYAVIVLFCLTSVIAFGIAAGSKKLAGTPEKLIANKNYTYKILGEEKSVTPYDGRTFQNFNVLLNTNDLSEANVKKAALEIKREICVDKCQISFFDDAKYYEVERTYRQEDKALSDEFVERRAAGASLETAREWLNERDKELKKKYWLDIADHLVAVIDWEVEGVEYYPYQDSEYKALGGKNTQNSNASQDDGAVEYDVNGNPVK